MSVEGCMKMTNDHLQVGFRHSATLPGVTAQSSDCMKKGKQCSTLRYCTIRSLTTI